MTDQTRGPIDWAQRRQAKRETRQTTNPEAAEREQRLVDAHQATIGQLRRAEARVRALETEAGLLRRYREWLATQHANAVRADQAGSVPDRLKISPHNGIAAGLHTALLGLDRILNPHDAGPTVAEAAAQDRAYWERKDAGEQP